MSKVKIRKTETKEIETDFDYPVYLYFQDENCMDEYIKVDEKSKISVKYSYFGLTIERSYSSWANIEEHHLTNNQTTKERFEIALKEAIQSINE